jgi:hypothetical protein
MANQDNQVNTPFNPAFGNPDANYLGYSRGADPAPAQKGPAVADANQSFKMGVDLFNTVVVAKDTINQDRIRTDLTEQVDANRDPWIGASAESGAASDTMGGSTPVDLQKQLERMQNVTNAVRSNKMSDRYYWAQMENIARATRSRYPGYREYIDKVMSQLTGGTPANELQRSVLQQANESMGSEAKELQSLKSAAAKDEDVGITPEVEAMTDPAQVRQYISNRKAIFGRIKVEQAQLSLDASRGQDVSRRSYEAFKNDYNTQSAVVLNQAIDQFRSGFVSAVQNQSTLTEEQKNQIGADGAILKQQMFKLFDQVQAQYPNMRAEDLKAERANVEQRFNDLIGNVQNGQWNLVDAQANLFKMKMDATKNDVVDSSAASRTLAGVSAVHGPEMANNLYTLGDGKSIINEMVAGLSLVRDKIGKASIDATGNKPAISYLYELKNSKAENTAVAAQEFTNKMLTTLADPKATPAVKSNFAKSLFSPENKDFVLFFDESDNVNKDKDTKGTRLGLFRRMTSPAIVKTMEQIRDSGDTQTWQNYVNWREQSYVTLVKPELDKMKYIPVWDQTMNIQVGSDGKIIPQDRGAGVAAIDRTLSSWNDSQGTIQRFNSLVDAMTPTWDAQGLDPMQEVQKLLAAGGVDPQALKEDSFYSRLFKSMGIGDGNQVRAVLGRAAPNQQQIPVQGTPGTAAPAQAERPKGMMKLGGPTEEVAMNYGPGDRESSNVLDYRNGTPKNVEEYNDFIVNQNEQSRKSSDMVGNIRRRQETLNKSVEQYNEAHGTNYKREDLFEDNGMIKSGSGADEEALFQLWLQNPARAKESPPVKLPGAFEMTADDSVSTQITTFLADTVGIPLEQAKKLVSALDLTTGIPSLGEAVQQGDAGAVALQAALTAIPGGRAAGAAKSAGKASLEAVEGGLNAFSKEARSVLDDWTRGMNEAADESNRMFASMRAKYGENVSSQFSLNVLNDLPKPRTNPNNWSKEETLAVANVLGRASYLKSRPGHLSPEQVKEIDKLAQQYRMFSVEGAKQ